jgi:F-type H+-transporting ATPase subunit gamma
VSLIEVKNQIQSTKNTKKITKAMQLVAASKMKRFQRMAVQTRQYAYGLVKALRLTQQQIAKTQYGQAHGDKHLFVLLTSDKGLCGAMNTRLLRLLWKGELWNELPADKRTLITIGRKSTEAAKYQGVKVERSFIRVNEEMTPLEAMEIIDDILELWETKEYAAVHLISPWYVNAFTFETSIVTMLPLNDTQIAEFEKHVSAEVVAHTSEEGAHFFEPTRERVAEALAEQITQSLFIEAFYQLKATEFSSRMSAMKKATDAADDQIKLLTAKFNKARQAAITQQLAELASASEAMSTANSYENLE